MVIQFRSLKTGRKVKSFAKLTSEYPASLVLRNGKVLDVHDWKKGKARVLHATNVERAGLVGWLLHNLPNV
jgi:hypothetical protein